MAAIDHFMYAVPSLDEGMAWAAETFDAAPAYGGEHVGLGTRNALLALGETYLEIIAPDPAQDLANTMGGRFAAMRSGGLVTWAARGDLNTIATKLSEFNIACRGPNRTQRNTAEGELLVWELLFPSAPQFGPRMPFFIDWLACPHPADTNPVGGAFKQLTLTLPEPAALQQVLAELGLNLAVQPGEPGLSVTIATGKGDVELRSTAETADLGF